MRKHVRLRGCKVTRVRDFLCGQGIRGDDNLEQVLYRYEQFETPESLIAKELKTPLVTVKMWRKKLGINKRQKIKSGRR